MALASYVVSPFPLLPSLLSRFERDTEREKTRIYVNQKKEEPNNQRTRKTKREDIDYSTPPNPFILLLESTAEVNETKDAHSLL